MEQKTIPWLLVEQNMIIIKEYFHSEAELSTFLAVITEPIMNPDKLPKRKQRLGMLSLKNDPIYKVLSEKYKDTELTDIKIIEMAAYYWRLANLYAYKEDYTAIINKMGLIELNINQFRGLLIYYLNGLHGKRKTSTKWNLFGDGRPR